MVRVEIGVLNRRYLACQISAIKFAKCARSRDFFYAHRCELPVKRFYHMNNPVIGKKKIARCVRINRLRKSLAIFAGDQIRCDRRLKCPGVSPA